MTKTTEIPGEEKNAAEIVMDNMVALSKRGRNRLADFESVQAKAEDAQAAQEPTLSEVAGLDGSPIVREGLTFFPRSPKIRALDAMTATLQQMQAAEIGQGEAVLKMATFFLRVKEGETCRAATYDEIADSFELHDIALLGEMARKYLNIQVAGSKGSSRPNV